MTLQVSAESNPALAWNMLGSPESAKILCLISLDLKGCLYDKAS